MKFLPNKSLLATRDGAFSSAVPPAFHFGATGAFHVASRRRFCFFFMRSSLITLLCLSVVFAGCGGRQRTVAGDFRLEQWEDGTTFYLHKRGHDDSSEGGSIIGGIILRIGWSSRYIVAQRHSIFRGDPDGWMIIDVQTSKITGPFTDTELQARSEARGITTYPVSEAWSRM